MAHMCIGMLGNEKILNEVSINFYIQLIFLVYRYKKKGFDDFEWYFGWRDIRRCVLASNDDALLNSKTGGNFWMRI